MNESAIRVSEEISTGYELLPSGYWNRQELARLHQRSQCNTGSDMEVLLLATNRLRFLDYHRNRDKHYVGHIKNVIMKENLTEVKANGGVLCKLYEMAQLQIPVCLAVNEEYHVQHDLFRELLACAAMNVKKASDLELLPS